MNYNYINTKIKVSETTTQKGKYTFLKNGKIHDMESIEFVYTLLKNETTEQVLFLDIGAHCGSYSLLGTLLPNISIHSFEPNPEIFECLVENISLNDITTIIPYCIGLSDTCSEKILHICPEHSGLSTFGENITRFDKTTEKQITTKTDTIDNLFYSQEKRISMIKMDTEGYEYFILKGGKECIQRDHPDLLLEVNPNNLLQTNVHIKELFSLLHELGYQKTIVLNQENFLFKWFDIRYVPLEHFFDILDNTSTTQDTMLYSENTKYEITQNEFFSIPKDYDLICFIEKDCIPDELDGNTFETLLRIPFCLKGGQTTANAFQFLLSSRCIRILQKIKTIVKSDITFHDFLEHTILSEKLNVYYFNSSIN